MARTAAQILLAQHLKELKLGPIVEELRFHAQRKWRFDLAIPDVRIAFEANGGKWSGGHRRGKAIEEENLKLNTATMMGWRVFQFTNEQILDGRAKEFIKRWLGARHQ